MKIRGSIFLIIVAAFAVTLILWFGKRRQAEAPPISSLESNGAPLVAATQSRMTRSNGPAERLTDTSDSSNSTQLTKAGQETGILSTYNDQPIVFYGRIEDQFSNAVANATVNFGVRIINGYESTVKRGQVLSDANGMFTISGYKGQNLGIGVVKSGYTWMSMQGSGIYSQLWPEEQRAHPDPNNPTIIKMWKLQGAEPLVSIDQQYKLTFTDEPIYFDLIAGKIVSAGGDLKVIVTRAPGVITQRKPDHRDWSIALFPVNGGIMEPEYNTSHFTFEAPVDGYQDSYPFQMNHDDKQWFDNIKKAFFLKSRNGQIYSKFSLYFEINDDPNGTMRFQFTGVANTNGSRNWEETVPK